MFEYKPVISKFLLISEEAKVYATSEVKGYETQITLADGEMFTVHVFKSPDVKNVWNVVDSISYSTLGIGKTRNDAMQYVQANLMIHDTTKEMIDDLVQERMAIREQSTEITKAQFKMRFF